MRAPFLRFILILPIAVVPLVWALWLAHAASRTWTGNGGNDLWTTAANWSGGLVAPSAGDDLIFPTSSQRNSVNKFAIGTTFNSLSVSGGHSMTGNSISLNSGITAAGGLIDLSSIKLNNNQTFDAPTAGTGAIIDSAIDNNGKNLTLNGPGAFTINGSISGAGNLIKNGTGTTVLAGNNSYMVAVVFNGTLLVFGSQPNSNVVISGGTLGGSGTVGELTFGLQGGSISPAAANNGTGILTVNGNASLPSAGIGFLEVDLNSATLGSGYDQLEVNGTVNLGSGSPASGLRVNLGFTPPPGTTFTIIDNDGTDAVTGHFANLPEGSTFTVNNGTTFRITYQGGTNANDVVLTVISGALKFTASSFTAQEGVGAANITLSRTGGGNTTAVARVTLTDVTTSPADYRFTPGALDATFNPGSGANAEVFTTALQADGKIILGGAFTTYNGTSSNKLARLNPDGSLDTTFDIGSGPSSNVLTLIVQPDGKIIVGGTFISYNNTPRNFIARLNTNGSLDTTFDPGSSANSSVITAALQADGKIIIGGFLTKSIARLNANGSVDTTFAPVSGANDSVNTIAIQPDGKIIICGNFSLYNGIARNRIARLNADGSLDSTFDPGSGANNSLAATALQSDGKIIIGGFFTTFNSVARNRIARLNAGGSIDATFDPGSGTNGQVNTIAVQPDGKIIIGGNFFNYNSTPRNNIARLNSDGSLDTTFIPGSGANILALTTALQPDGKIILGGLLDQRIGRIDGDLFATWGPNDFANKTITLPIVSDGLVEDVSETLNLALLPFLNAVAGTPSSATLTITDPIVRRWNGAGTTNNWAEGANWDGGGVPGAGDDLVFPAGAARLQNSNNFPAGTTFNSITISGGNYRLGGNAIALTFGINDSADAQTFIGFASIKLNRNQTFKKETQTNPFTMQIDSAIDTNGKTLTLDGAGQKRFHAVITGSGGLVVNGTGNVQLPGTVSLHTFTGPTIINSGSYDLLSDAPNSQIQLNGGVLRGNQTVKSIEATGGTIQQDSSLGPPLDSINAVSLNSAVTFAVGLLRTDTESRNGSLTVGGTINLGDNLGNSTLTVSSTFFRTPAPGETFTIINKTSAGAVQGTFNNLPEGSVLLVGGVGFRISYLGGDGNDVVLHVPAIRTWNGGGTTNNWTEAANWVGGAAPGAGDDLVFPLVAARFSNFNDFPINTTFGSLTISGGGYTLNGNALRLISNLVNDNQSTNLVNNTISLVINGQGGVITSSVKTNLGLILLGNNTYGGTTTINSGHLVVRGIQPTSAVVINSGSLEGDGVVGPVSLNGGSVRPGLINILTSSVLSLRGDLVFSSAAQFSPTLINDATNHLQTNTVRVNGTVALNDAGLFMFVIHSPNPPVISPGTSITLIDNDGTDAVNGKFFSFPEGSVLTISGQQLQLSYVGGDGNDVVLTALTVPVPTIQFTNLTFPVSESDGSVTLTVTRTNDTSTSASVDFHTIDTDTFTVGCFDTVNNQGGAFGRCDFATVVGTLQFDPGEVNKTITVPIIDDAFVEGAETFKVIFENPVGAFLGNIPAATVSIQANDTAGLANPIFQSPFFVRQHYLDFLSREPDAAGFNAWVNLLNGCPDINNLDPNAASAACDRIIVSQSFFGSQEFQLKGFYVFRFYKLAFNRLPEYLEIVSDMSFVAGATAEEVFQRKAQLAVKFTQRPEFQTAFGGLTNAAYVNALLSRYQLTQITTPDPQQPDGTQKVTLTAADLTNQLNNATLTRAQVLRAIADSDQVVTAEFNNAFVAMQYYGYLRRKPDTPGFNAWLGVLQTGDVRTMINGFMNSQEYRLRFGPQ